MGIRVYESEDMFSDDDNNTCCCSHSSCRKSTSAAATTTTNNGCSSSPPPACNGNFYMSNTAYKDIVGNCKEVRIEENTTNLRIVGNNNRIRITVNTGDLIVIGNNTRLKIQTNHGQIKYTGNDGRICLGSESQQQLVEYIGNNGTLKIINSMKFAKSKCAVDQNNKNKSPFSRKCNETSKETYSKLSNDKKTKPMGSTENTENPPKPSASKHGKSKEKSLSYGGSSSPRDEMQWQTFNAIFNQAQKSMPNLTTNLCGPAAAASVAPSTIVQSIGNIVIANASNICISPYVRNVTAKA